MRKQVRLAVVDQPVAPDVPNHVGCAIRRIRDDEIGPTLPLYEALLRENSAQDLMAADVRSEVRAAEGGGESI